ncbi:MAG: hypothetical protein ACSHX6_07445 [Akkermansiaceae bacterium]
MRENPDTITISNARKANGETYDKIWKKVGGNGTKWTYAKLEKKLSLQEYRFIVAIMFRSVGENGGFLHAMEGYRHERSFPGVIEAWRDIGAEGQVRMIETAERQIDKLGLCYHELQEEGRDDFEKLVFAQYGPFVEYEQEERMLYRYQVTHELA